MIKHVLCDFDGTLVDSSPGILETLKSCIDRERLSYRIEPSRHLIGPPLRSMISKVIDADSMTIDRIETAFRREYDESGYRRTAVYPGIAKALECLKARGVTLHIVSNKRRVPLLSILETESWMDNFLTINTLDSTPGASSKSDVVCSVLRSLSISRDTALLVGDSLDDQIAAARNDIQFAWASWGYGKDEVLRSAGKPLVDAMDLVQRVFS